MAPNLAFRGVIGRRDLRGLPGIGIGLCRLTHGIVLHAETTACVRISIHVLSGFSRPAEPTVRRCLMMGKWVRWILRKEGDNGERDSHPRH